MNYFSGGDFEAALVDTQKRTPRCSPLQTQWPSGLTSPELPGVSPSDIFDMFCHWLVSIKSYEFGTTQYWKISPGEEGRLWDQWQEAGFVALGWPEFGDLTGVSKEQFKTKRDQLNQRFPDYTKHGTRQVWQFTRIAEGDRVIANRGNREILGVGTVLGPYYFEIRAEYPHRFPVQWDDVSRRPVDEPRWSRALMELDSAEFHRLKSRL